MYDEICTLVPVTITANAQGDTIEVDGTARQVFCRVKSYSLKEKLKAQTEGVIPELTFVLSDKLEYSNEPALVYNNVRYRIIHVAFNDLQNEVALVVTKWQQN